MVLLNHISCVLVAVIWVLCMLILVSLFVSPALVFCPSPSKSFKLFFPSTARYGLQKIYSTTADCSLQSRPTTSFDSISVTLRQEYSRKSEELGCSTAACSMFCPANQELLTFRRRHMKDCLYRLPPKTHGLQRLRQARSLVQQILGWASAALQ